MYLLNCFIIWSYSKYLIFKMQQNATNPYENNITPDIIPDRTSRYNEICVNCDDIIPAMEKRVELLPCHHHTHYRCFVRDIFFLGITKEGHIDCARCNGR